jgi:Rod binding domain-containing protein
LSISPPSDIIIDVASAADPQAYRAAVEKLARASESSNAAAEFASVAAAVAAPPDAGAPSASKPVAGAPSAAPSTSDLPATKLPAKTPIPKAYTQFEAFFLQTFVESMLPKDANALFGSGMAGNIWKSMLAQHLADELAQSAAFGIAKKLAENRAVRDKPSTLKPAEHAPSAAAESPGKTAAAGYVASLQKLLAADGKQAVSQAQPAAALAQMTKGS